MMARKWSSQKTGNVQNLNGDQVSLIIPFRNESHNAEELFRQLAKVTEDVSEILLINDQSEDDSRDIFLRQAEKNERIKIWDSPGIGKKAAVEFGVAKAKGLIILVSDADCFLSETWIKKMLEPFSDAKVQLVAGPVLSKVERIGFFDCFQQIEWASILLMTQFFFRIHRPLMCSAANLAYRKKAFVSLGGYSGNADIASGDDEFLLKKIVKKYGAAACHYQIDRSALVLTRPQEDFFALINQRMRWAGKWRQKSSILHWITPVVFALFQAIWISSMCLPFFGGIYILLFLGVWGVKVGGESLVLGKVLRSLGKKLPISDFIKTSFFHPFYVISTVSGVFFWKFVWKGRSD